ncbi:MAG: ATP-grasp domain-containing protein [Nitrospinota bacterium]|nr:ATP-grasp domain-containing protein [Nitrospinota bacterium]
MKIAVVYNRDSKSVINLFGTPNREKYGLKAIKRILDSLKKGGHQAIAVEGDKDLIKQLENFMPRALKGERPGMVFNLSYGIQGQARYTHVPGILEMVGVPYIGSGPLSHSLCLDKVVAKMIFRQHGLPTPDFAVLDDPDFEDPPLEYPIIVKPKNEAVSLGLRIVYNKEELREAAGKIFEMFNQPVLAEAYIDGIEINVGLLGNMPTEAFVPAEIVFEGGGPAIYTWEDKTHRSDRTVRPRCPARISEETALKAKELALKAFKALNCADCARVDMRIDSSGNIYILEINSLPSLGENGSFVAAAANMGLDFDALVNRLVEVASARYFGTPNPPPFETTKESIGTGAFNYLTERRDQIEKSLQEWTNLPSRTSEPVEIQNIANKLDEFFNQIAMSQVPRFTNNNSVWTWETKKGMEKGVLIVGHLDVPIDESAPRQMFRKDPELLYGEGIGISRAPLVSMMYALRSLRSLKVLRNVPLGVLYYADEGEDYRYSRDIIRKAMSEANKIIVLRPGTPDCKIITNRRGQKNFRLVIEGKKRRLGQSLKQPEPLNWLMTKMKDIFPLTSKKNRTAVSIIDIKLDAFPMLLPHRVTALLQISYPDEEHAQSLEKEIFSILGKTDLKWKLEMIAERPPMLKRKQTDVLAKEFVDIASQWEIPLELDSSVWPSVAGLAPKDKGVLCGIGPVAQDLYTTQESVQRISLVQRTLLLTEFLATELKKI